MIINYNTYINEKNTFNVFKSHIEDIFKKYDYLRIEIDTETIYVEDVDTDDGVIGIYYKENSFKTTFHIANFKIKEYENSNIKKFNKNLQYNIDNYYEILKTNEKVISSLTENPYFITSIPIFDIEKYCDYIVYSYQNINREILNEFIESVYNIKTRYSDIIEYFNSKYSYIVNAKNFDLI